MYTKQYIYIKVCTYIVYLYKLILIIYTPYCHYGGQVYLIASAMGGPITGIAAQGRAVACTMTKPNHRTKRLEPKWLRPCDMY